MSKFGMKRQFLGEQVLTVWIQFSRIHISSLINASTIKLVKTGHDTHVAAANKNIII